MTVRVLYLTMNPNRASTTVPTECWLRLLPARGLEPARSSRSSNCSSRGVTCRRSCFAMLVPFCELHRERGTHLARCAEPLQTTGSAGLR